jgi:four helix bundle protein
VDLYHTYRDSDISYGAAIYHAAPAVYHTAKPYIINNSQLPILSFYDIFWYIRGEIHKSDNRLLDLSVAFAIKTVELVDSVKVPKSSYMLDQLARSGTSIGANIHEAQYAHSKADFIAKLEIALKEASETSYWLGLLHETKRIDDGTHQSAEKLCGNIRRLLIASCKTAKGK